MPRRKVSSTTTGLLALGLVTTLMLVTASPALAAHVVVGAGAGHGWEYPSEHNPPGSQVCPPPFAVLAHDKFELFHQGTYDVLNQPGSNAIASYVGPTTVEITVDTHVISPLGVGPTCALPLGPVAIRNAKVVGHFTEPVTGLRGSVNCEYSSGTYERIQSAVSFQLVPGNRGPGNQGTGTCNIDGNVPLASGVVQNVPTYHVIAGTMNPCSFPVIDPITGEPVDDPATPEEDELFIPNPECAAFEQVNPSDGDPGSHLITTYVASGAGTTP